MNRNPSIELLKNHYLVRNRYNNEEYLIDQNNYQYVQDCISMTHESIYLLPDHECIQAELLVDDHHTETCTLRINAMIFE